MKNNIRCVLSLAVAGLSAACGHIAPQPNSGPALAKEKVQIILAGEQCYVNRSGKEYATAVNDDQLHVAVSLQVTNQSNHVVVLSLAAFLLEESRGGEPTQMHPEESGSASLSPGQSTDVVLDFTQPGGLDCHHELTLNAQNAITVEGRPVYLASIHFLPSR